MEQGYCQDQQMDGKSATQGGNSKLGSKKNFKHLKVNYDMGEVMPDDEVSLTPNICNS